MNTYAWYFKIKNIYKAIYGYNYQCKNIEKIVKLPNIQGIPSIPGIQDIPNIPSSPSIPGLLKL